MTLPMGFGKLDFADWARGVIAAFITGGAGAVSSAFSVTAIDPDHFKMGGTKFFEVAASVFLITGFLNMMSFLRTKPLPEMKTVVTELKQEIKPGTTATVTEIHQEPRTPAPVDTSEI